MSTWGCWVNPSAAEPGLAPRFDNCRANARPESVTAKQTLALKGLRGGAGGHLVQRQEVSPGIDRAARQADLSAFVSICQQLSAIVSNCQQLKAFRWVAGGHVVLREEVSPGTDRAAGQADDHLEGPDPHRGSIPSRIDYTQTSSSCSCLLTLIMEMSGGGKRLDI